MIAGGRYAASPYISAGKYAARPTWTREDTGNAENGDGDDDNRSNHVREITLLRDAENIGEDYSRKGW